MKKLFSVLLILSVCIAHGQSVVPIRADTLKVYKQGGSAELVLQNATKNVAGFLYNNGNGVTSFKRGAVQLNDSTFVIGADTIIIHAGSSTPLSVTDGLWFNHTGTYPSFTFKVDTSAAAGYLLRRKDSIPGGYYPYSSNPMGYLTTIDSSNIPGFAAKVRSLFSAGSFMTYNSATGRFSIDSSRVHSIEYNDTRYASAVGNLSPLFSSNITSGTISYSLSNASAYTIFGRGSGSGAPSYLSSIDSNWVPGLHTQAYYDGRYAGISSLSGYVPTSRTITINGITYDLTSNRSWAINGGGNYGDIQINRNGLLAGTDSIKMDSVFRVIAPTSVSDSVKSLNQLVHGSINVGDVTQGTDVFVWFGTSVSAGYNLPSPTTQRFSHLTSRNFASLELNRARSGTRMTFSSAGDSSMIERINLIPIKAAPYTALFFEYWLNDDLAGVDTTTFKTAFYRVIDTCFARGWTGSDIYLLGPTYNWYSLTPHTNNGARAIRTVAETKGVQFVDVTNYMLTHGGTSLIQADSLHPNVQGDEVTRQAISQYIKDTRKRLGDLVVTGNSTTNGITYFKSDASGTNGGLVAIDDVNTGFGVLAGNADQAYVLTGGAPAIAFTRNFMQGDANWQYAWTTGAGGGFAGGPDAGIAKLGSAALKISNGSTGWGSLSVSALKTHGTTSGDVTIQSSTGTYTLTLPADDGTPGQSLQTDGSGVLSWQTVTSGGADSSVYATRHYLDSLLGIRDSIRVGNFLVSHLGSGSNPDTLLIDTSRVHSIEYLNARFASAVGNLSPLFTSSLTAGTISYSLSNASAYTIFGRGSGSGAPSYLSSLDSNWIPGLHTQAYYDLRYALIGSGGTYTASRSIDLSGADFRLKGDSVTLNGPPYVYGAQNGIRTFYRAITANLTAPTSKDLIGYNATDTTMVNRTFAVAADYNGWQSDTLLTTNATPTTLATITVGSSGQQRYGTIEVTVNGSTSTSGIMGKKLIRFRAAGTTVTILDVTDVGADILDTLTTATWTATTGTGTIIIQATGQSSNSITWISKSIISWSSTPQ